jgi:hypothetical protein
MIHETLYYSSLNHSICDMIQGSIYTYVENQTHLRDASSNLHLESSSVSPCVAHALRS